jgi:hypothetical protein
MMIMVFCCRSLSFVRSLSVIDTIIDVYAQMVSPSPSELLHTGTSPSFLQALSSSC